MNRITNPRTTVVALLAGTALSLSAPCEAGAIIISWNNAAGGGADVAGNWSPNQVPTGADTAEFPVAGAYAVAFPAAASVTDVLSVSRGTMTWNMTAPHTTGAFRVGALAGSTGTVNLASGSITATDPTLAIVLGVGGTGNMTVRSGTSIRATSAAGDILVGVTSTGSLNLNNGGLAEAGDDIGLGSVAGANGTILVAGSGVPAPSTLRTLGADGDMAVGISGTGVVTAQSAGRIEIARDVAVGTNAGATGTLRVQTVGLPGTLTAGRNLDIARNTNAGVSAGTGSVFIEGAGSTATVAGITAIGDPDSVGGGALHVNNGGLLTTTGGLTLLPANTLNINGGTVTTAGTALLEGVTTITEGTLNAAVLSVSGGTSITASGRIRAAIGGATTFTSTLTLSGPLEMGPVAPGGSFGWGGSFNVGPHDLSAQVTAGLFVRLGECTLGGGSINILTPGVGFIIPGGDSINGFGAVNAPLQINAANTLSVTAAGTGLNFNGLVTGSATFPILMNGTRVTFNGGLTAMGDVSAETFSGPATITATGPLSLGNPASFDGVHLLGRLIVGPHLVTLRDTSQAELGGAAVLDGGTLNCTSSIELIGNGRIAGVGAVGCDVGNHRTTTTVAPGGVGPGSLAFLGNYAQGDNDFGGGRLELEVFGTNPGEFDSISIGQTASLGGHIQVRHILPFFPFDSTYAITILTAAGGMNGEFATVDLGGVVRGSLYLRYYADRVDLVYCVADFNQDASLDPDDLSDFITCFFTQVQAPGACPGADFNTDGNVDPDDLADFITAFFAGCG